MGGGGTPKRGKIRSRGSASQPGGKGEGTKKREGRAAKEQQKNNAGTLRGGRATKPIKKKTNERCEQWKGGYKYPTIQTRGRNKGLKGEGGAILLFPHRLGVKRRRK